MSDDRRPMSGVWCLVDVGQPSKSAWAEFTTKCPLSNARELWAHLLITTSRIVQLVVDSNAGRMWLMALATPIMWSMSASLLIALVQVPMTLSRINPNGLLTAGRTAGGHGRWLIATERWCGRWLGRIL